MSCVLLLPHNFPCAPTRFVKTLSGVPGASCFSEVLPRAWWLSSPASYIHSSICHQVTQNVGRERRRQRKEKLIPLKIYLLGYPWHRSPCWPFLPRNTYSWSWPASSDGITSSETTRTKARWRCLCDIPSGVSLPAQRCPWRVAEDIYPLPHSVFPQGPGPWGV